MTFVFEHSFCFFDAGKCPSHIDTYIHETLRSAPHRSQVSNQTPNTAVFCPNALLSRSSLLLRWKKRRRRGSSKNESESECDSESVTLERVQVDQSVRFDGAINPPDKSVGGQEAHGPGQQAVHGAGQQTVAEEEQARHEALDVEFGPVEPGAVDEDPNRGAGPDEDGPPPPAVVLGAELDVRGHDGDLDDGDDADEGDDAQEAEDVVVPALVLPDAAEDEEQLDEEDRERDEAREQDAVDAPGVPRLRRHGAGDAVDLGRVFVGWAAVVAEPAAAVDERELDQEPEGEQSDQGAERERGAGCLGPDEEVEDEDGGEEEAGEEEGGHERVAAPILAVERLVDPAGEVAREDAREDEEAHADADEAAAEAGVEDAEGAEDEETGRHEDELGARADQGGQEAGVFRRAEDVAVQELPAGYVFDVLLIRGRVAVEVGVVVLIE